MAITLTAGAFTAGAGFWAFAVFVKPMSEELGWSRTEIFGAMAVRALVAGVLAPFVGPLQDSRLGPRFFAVTTTLTLVGSMIAMQWINDLLLFYVVFGVLSAFTTFGSTEMMLSVVLPRWFVRRRGSAIGIGSMGTAMGPLFFPFIVAFLLTLFEWRDAWAVLGLLTLATLGPMSLLVRSRPEDMGLLPDGDSLSDDSTSIVSEPVVPKTGTETSFTARQVVRMQCFWLLVLAISLAMLGFVGFQANWLPYFQDIGFSATQASLAATAYGICSVSTRIIWGWLAERFPVRYMMGLQALLTGLSVLLFFNIHSELTLILATASNGLAAGGIFVMRPMIIAAYFGRAHLGAINGIIRPFLTIGTAGSPLLVAAFHDLRGDYQLAFWVVAACWFVAAVTVIMARSPQRRPAPQLTA